MFFSGLIIFNSSRLTDIYPFKPRVGKGWGGYKYKYCHIVTSIFKKLETHRSYMTMAKVQYV